MWKRIESINMGMLLTICCCLLNLLILTTMTNGTFTGSVADIYCPDDPCESWQWTNASAVNVFQLNLPTQKCCGLCLCNNVTCHVYGKFCQETENQLINNLEQFPMAAQNQTCFNLQIESSELIPYNSHAVYMTSSCLNIYRDSAEQDPEKLTIIDMCENAKKFTSLSSRIPVIDIRTGLTFYNTYCAACNEIPDAFLVQYEVQIVCQQYAFYMPSSDYSKIIHDLLETDGCTLWFTKPAGLYLDPPSCNPKGYGLCAVNTTVQCYTDSTMQQHICYMAHYRSGSFSTCDIHRNFRPFPLTLVLTLTAPSSASSSQIVPEIAQAQAPVCSTGYFYDTYKSRCRSLSCVAPKSLIDNECKSSVATISGGNFDVFLKLTPTTKLGVNEIMSLNTEGVAYLDNFMKSLGFGNSTDVDIYGKTTFVHDLETGSVDVVFKYFICHIQMNLLVTQTINSNFIDAFIEMNDKNSSFTSKGVIFNTELIDAETTFRTLVYWPNTKQEDELIRMSIKPFINLRLGQIVKILPTSGCPLVTLDTREFDIQEEPWGIEIPELNATLMKWNYIAERYNATAVISSVSMCVQDYEALLPCPDIGCNADEVNRLLIGYANTSNNYSGDPVYVLKDGETSSTISVLLTCVCMGLSIVGALLTILTYSLFRVMRKQPGINNIALCSSLIAAQMLFLFGIGQKDYIPFWACKFIGICIHFFWLLTIMWMNVCSYHTFRVFWTLGNKNQKGNGSCRTTCWYILYTTTTAAIPVVINMVITVAKNSYNETDDNIGYGQRSCYISSRTNVKITFALPICLVVIVNSVLFVATVFKVRKMSNNVVVKFKERKYSGSYFRLSTMTGFLWLFGFIYMFTGNAVLEILFILFNATQGVFIFFSFVCNKTCARHYLSLVSRLRKPSVAPSTTGTAYGASVTPM